MLLKRNLSLKSTVNALISARINNSLLPEKFPLNDLSNSYRIISHIIDDNNFKYQQIGWKIGATNDKAQQSLNAKEPFYGPLHRNYIFNNNEKIKLNGYGIFRAIEAEFCVKLKNDIVKKQNPYNPMEVFNSIEGIYPAIEIAATRFTTSNLDIYNVISDFALNGCCIINTNHNLLQSNNNYDYLSNIPIVININNNKIISSTGANVLGNPIHALTWLVNKLHENEYILKKNDVIMTGACCLINDINLIKNNDIIQVDFDGNKNVNITAII